MPDGSCLPENSLAAFRRAEGDGLTFELDVRRLRDGTPVVFHDETVERLTGGTGKVAAMNWPEISSLRLRSVRGPTNESIPSLGEVLDGTSGGMLVELKGDHRDPRELVDAALREIERRADARARVVIQSFDPAILAAVADRDPSLFRCQLVSPGLATRFRIRCVRDLLRVSAAEALAVNLPWTSRRATKAWQASGLRVLAWTAKSARDVRLGQRLGLDRLITDFVPDSGANEGGIGP
jgi:glycerophosphoryl diester phosphodiesterase